ncbi:hypothetical protein TEA_000840 [Camellia sinensis var. sinensis]|uniref:Uncharacterized protein n=1 Tax=Camellia sinensis var. sinensis TaxID=542762 RepID=A0A4V6RY87_CAMSN|nr:hypothetical protein TEA_000840 [Camellia sinensis var. sinensis]
MYASKSALILIRLDCPDSVPAYIHGWAALLLSVVGGLHHLLESIHIQRDKEVFDVMKLPIADTQHHWFSNHGFEEKKLKINVHRPVGTRVVFDDEGNTLPPLATLADVKSGDDSVQLDKDTVSKRYAEMREELKQHDKEDKLLDRERRKEKRMKQKMKLKRGRKEEEDDEGEEDLSGSDGEATRNRANKRSKKYFDSDSDDAERKRDNDKLAIKADSISLAEQEELALKLLSSMHS